MCARGCFPCSSLRKTRRVFYLGLCQTWESRGAPGLLLFSCSPGAILSPWAMGSQNALLLSVSLCRLCQSLLPTVGGTLTSTLVGSHPSFSLVGIGRRCVSDSALRPRGCGTLAGRLRFYCPMTSVGCPPAAVWEGLGRHLPRPFSRPHFTVTAGFCA